MATTSKTQPKTSSKPAPAASKAAQNGQSVKPHRAEQLNIGLENADMDETSRLLNDLLANYQVLAVKTKNYHWNVVGMHFMTLHIFLEKMYGFLTEEADEVAERIRSLGDYPLGNMATFIQRASIKEETREGIKAIEMLRTLLTDEEAMIRQMRDIVDRTEDELGDKGSSDFVTGLMEEREKNAWMLRSFIQGYDA